MPGFFFPTRGDILAADAHGTLGSNARRSLGRNVRLTMLAASKEPRHGYA
jgi:hypothetical protein